jgi:tetratricopeptide (TPR) repeat protein
LRSVSNDWCGPLLAKGTAATMGCVDEPYLDGTPNIGIFFQRWLGGFSFGEAAYASQLMLSWQTTVVGDPLYRPFGKVPREQDAELAARHSPLLEWARLRYVNMGLLYNVPPAQLVTYLESQPETHNSAVLMEKLGDLHQMDKQTDPAIKSWQQALKLNPTPQQTVRLTLLLGDKLIAAGKDDQALALYDNFLKENPEYPDALSLYQKLEDLARKLHKRADAKRYQAEIARLTPPSGK